MHFIIHITQLCFPCARHRRPNKNPEITVTLELCQGWPRLELVVRGADAHGRHRLAGGGQGATGEPCLTD